MNYYYQNQPPSKTRRSKKNIKKLTIPTSILILGFILISMINSSQETVVFTIQSGESLSSISKRLDQANIINSSFFFRRHLANQNLDQKIQVGSFTIPTNSSNQQVAEIITNPQLVNNTKLTIPEGYKVSQIDETLYELGIIQKGEFMTYTQNPEIQHPILNYIPENKNSLEGFLYPDTYFIDPGQYTSADLVQKMLNNFQSKLPQDWESKIQNLPEKDLYSLVTMASIVEREVLSAKDKSIVAGILWKRLASDWRIDADAALLYDQDDNIITQTDLQSNSPYNLRKFKGLSPTPISNPSQETIQATLNPTPTDYWFYLTTLDTGDVIYSKTIEEHNLNVQKHLR